MVENLYSEYPKDIQRQLWIFDRQKDHVIGLIPVYKFAKSAQKEFNSRYGDKNISVFVNDDDIAMFISQITDIKQITPLLRYCAKEGYHQTTKKYITQSNKTISYTLGTLRIVVWLSNGEGASCKFVKVGMKEEPVFELQCNGDKT